MRYPHRSLWLLLALGAVLGAHSPAVPAAVPPVRTPRPSVLPERYGLLPLAFEENCGQTDPEVRYLARGPGGTVFLTADATVLALAETGPEPAPGRAPRVRRCAVRPRLLGARRAARVGAFRRVPGRVSYLLGRDSHGWRRSLPRTKRPSPPRRPVRWRSARPP